MQYNLSFCECIFRLGDEETELTPGLKNEIYHEQSEDTVAYIYINCCVFVGLTFVIFNKLFGKRFLVGRFNI